MSRTYCFDDVEGEEFWQILCTDTKETIDSRNWSNAKEAHKEGYLKSNHWQKLREEYISEHGDLCEKCLKNEGYAVMHKSKKAFNNLGSEKFNDLIYLCSDCSESHYNDLFCK